MVAWLPRDGDAWRRPGRGGIVAGMAEPTPCVPRRIRGVPAAAWRSSRKAVRAAIRRGTAVAAIPQLGAAGAVLMLSVFRISFEFASGWQGTAAKLAVGAALGFCVWLILQVPLRAAAWWIDRRPLRLSVPTEGHSVAGAGNPRATTHSVSVEIENCSIRTKHPCTIALVSVDGVALTPTARLLDSVDLAPDDEQTICVAYWTSRAPPLRSDEHIHIPGPHAGSIGGALMDLPAGSHRLVIRAEAPEAVPTICECNVSLVGGRLVLTRA